MFSIQLYNKTYCKKSKISLEKQTSVAGDTCQSYIKKLKRIKRLHQYFNIYFYIRLNNCIPCLEFINEFN